ncbi:hypothetical protein GIB67_039060 [Kingdonia uniflora]|uniref:Alpha-N-acetylglucosaminidase n=1 Tax=Kingdonia uniflora TaxID=39325 RepID=A0A7J7LKW2_9MAGN|nr:hypothetical protein GIB67_039060 [Kingdonia uniflora]
MKENQSLAERRANPCQKGSKSRLVNKVGVGLAMEGIEQNPIVYDLMSEMAFQHNMLNVKVWLDQYPARRYGRSNQLIQDAWNILYHTLYNCTDGGYFHLFSYLLPLRYDLVDLTRQALAKYANEVFLKIIEAYQLHNINVVAFYSKHFVELVEDMDTLLACHDGFLLGPWLESSKQLAQNPEQEKQFEWNARTQITMWFDNMDEDASLLRDYGNKYWSGLLRDYYGPRAAIYFKYLLKSLEEGNGFQLRDWRRDWIKLTNDWQSGRNIFPVESKGDALHTSRWLYGKYLSIPEIYDH